MTTTLTHAAIVFIALQSLLALASPARFDASEGESFNLADYTNFHAFLNKDNHHDRPDPSPVPRPSLKPGQSDMEMDHPDAPPGQGRGEYVRLTKQAGVMAFRNQYGTELKVKLTGLLEVSANGTHTGLGGGGHEISSLDGEDFSVDPPINTTVFGLPANQMGIHTKLENDAHLSFDIIIFAASGNITIGDPVNGPVEVFPVQAGTMKFNLNITSWAFCGDNKAAGCDGGMAAKFIRAEFTIFTTGNHSLSDRENVTFTPGQPHNHTEGYLQTAPDSAMLMSTLVDVDGTWTQMPQGYPSVRVNGEGNVVVEILIPTFTNYAFYDPVVTLTTTSTTSAASNINIHFLLVAVLVALASKSWRI